MAKRKKQCDVAAHNARVESLGGVKITEYNTTNKSDILGGILVFGYVTLLLSLPLSVFTMFAQPSPCKKYAYYLPATFVMCNLMKERE